MAVGLAYSPLWRAESGGTPLPVRRDESGMLEVAAPAGTGEVLLHHRPGGPERAGGMLSLASALLLLAGLVRRGR